jgi:hypothetical protein
MLKPRLKPSSLRFVTHLLSTTWIATGIWIEVNRGAGNTRRSGLTYVDRSRFLGGRRKSPNLILNGCLLNSLVLCTKLNCTVVGQPRAFKEEAPNTPEQFRGVFQWFQQRRSVVNLTLQKNCSNSSHVVYITSQGVRLESFFRKLMPWN